MKLRQSPQREADGDGFVTAVAAAEVPAGQVVAMTINGVDLALARWQGRVIAFNDRCPHAAASLAQGTFYRGKVECAEHSYVFDVQTGRTLWPPDEVCHLKLYPVKEEQGLIKVKLS